MANNRARLSNQKIRFDTEQHWNGDKGQDKQNNLNLVLSRIKGLVNDTRVQTYVNEGADKVRRLTTITGAAVIERTFCCSILGTGTRISPRSTGPIAGICVAFNPFSVIFNGPPTAASGVDTCSG